MTTLTIDLTAQSKAPAFSLAPGQSASYSSTGTFTGDLFFKRSRNQGATWETVAHPAIDTNVTAGTVKNETLAEERFRFEIYTDKTDPDNPIAVSGTVTTVIADAGDTVQELKDKNDKIYLTITDDGVTLPGQVKIVRTESVKVGAAGAEADVVAPVHLLYTAVTPTEGAVFASRAWTIDSIIARPSVSAASAATLTFWKAASGVPGMASGVQVSTGAFDMTSTAHINHNVPLNSGTAVQLSTGDVLGYVLAGASETARGSITFNLKAR